MRIITTVTFVLVIAISLFFRFQTKADNIAPEIKVKTENIKASCNVTQDELLSYVTATDNIDGDLTSRVFVEGISQFIEEGVSTVTFCVVDNNNNVAEKTVNLTFEDYESPTLRLSDDLVFYSGEAVNIEGCAQIEDCFDGNATERLSAIASSSVTSSGTIPVKFKFTNSKGFSYTWNIEALVLSNEDRNLSYSIELKEHLLVVKKGSEEPDYSSYFVKALYENDEITYPNLVIDSEEVDLSKAGTYNVWFKLYERSDEKPVCRERLIVICEENANEGN